MQIPISTVAELGLAIRAVRRHNAIRLDDLAATAGVSKQFTSDTEYGKPTVQLGLVLKLLDELGIRLLADIPQAAADELQALHRQGGPRAKRAQSDAQP
ncbi:transcriptional regulator [Xylophilus rhododendri]|uniref:Transcriptional regulator n=1 Tax=Xylophilus rhododendri TaxID=2697032 RepID=A0A857JDP1_9BURK|nr:transcriptional regulator [Xylophilus rhododendri]QHJ01073.1 transcriptional regulator [Xylophilus rhododendri]